ncbi:AbrB/MazE/SpoVT family DNA-binding domain-containing protein [Microcystis aeruginosa]|nr:AbrB/MazE/SpoVT family DNA-binding domain-containing protein [Microcystis aeruginosa]
MIFEKSLVCLFVMMVWLITTKRGMYYRDMAYRKICGTKKMNEGSKSVEVHLGGQGRLVIPATLRRVLGLEEGDRLIAREESGRLVLEKREILKQRLKARFAQLPQERSLVDELIAERREAAREEASE